MSRSVSLELPFRDDAQGQSSTGMAASSLHAQSAQDALQRVAAHRNRARNSCYSSVIEQRNALIAIDGLSAQPGHSDPAHYARRLRQHVRSGVLPKMRFESRPPPISADELLLEAWSASTSKGSLRTVQGRCLWAAVASPPSLKQGVARVVLHHGDDGVVMLCIWMDTDFTSLQGGARAPPPPCGPHRLGTSCTEAPLHRLAAPGAIAPA
jgi:hypothetical protein